MTRFGGSFFSFFIQSKKFRQMTTEARIALLDRLTNITRMFVYSFEQVNGSFPFTVAAFECHVTRSSGTIRLKSIKFWASSNKDPRFGEAVMNFDGDAEHMGSHVSHELLTQACQNDGNVSILIGCCWPSEQAEADVKENLSPRSN